MRGRLAFACVVLSIFVASRAGQSSPEGDGGKVSAKAAGPVEALSRCIIKRFENLDDKGLSRIPLVHSPVIHFRPETAEERSVVAKLDEDGWDVGFYLGGRRLLESGMTEAQWKKGGDGRYRRAMSRPVVISQENTPTNLPEPWELWEHGRKALAASGSADPYRSTLGRWSIEARPIRADRQACLNCHRSNSNPQAQSASPDDGKPPLKVGDALGVAIFVYAKAPQ
jgi:hypothetical protein